MKRHSIKDTEEFQLTMASLRVWHGRYPETKSVAIIELNEREQWTGPAGKLVHVGFYCVACKMGFKTHGIGGRTWKLKQFPGARAAWKHSQGSKHLRKHQVWLSKQDTIPAKRTLQHDNSRDAGAKRSKSDSTATACATVYTYLYKHDAAKYIYIYTLFAARQLA